MFRIPGLEPGATEPPELAVTEPMTVPRPASVAPSVTTEPVIISPLGMLNVPDVMVIVPLPADELFHSKLSVSARN